MSIIHGVQIGFKDVYPDEEALEIGSLLHGIPKSMLLMIVSGILAEQFKGATRVVDFLGNWFRSENNAFANDLLRKLQPFENNSGRILVAGVPAALKLYSYALNNLTEEKLLTDAQIEINLFKAFLVQNDLINLTDDKVTETTKDLDSKLRTPGMFFSSTVRFHDLIEYDPHELFVSEFIRAVFFFEFLEHRSDTKALLAKFFEVYDAGSWKEYLQRLSGISFNILNKASNGFLEITVPQGMNYQRDCKFLDTLSSIIYDELTDNDFKSLREKPLQKIGDGVYRIIFSLFCIERIFKGLYFNLKTINQTLPEEDQVKDFRRIYTTEFSEQHSLYLILKKAFPKKWICITGEEILHFDFQGGPDFYARYNNKAFVFESKDSLINAALKETGNFTLQVEDLKTKFQVSGRKPKATKQLMNVCRDLLSKKFLSVDGSYKAEHLKIYPIVVIHDRQLNVPGFNKILNVWFDEELASASLEFDTSNIKPITVIDTATLVLITELLNSRQLMMEKVIDDYHSFVKLKLTNQFRSEEQYLQHARDTMLPFSHFVGQLIERQKMKRFPEKMLRDKAFEALNDLPRASSI